LLRPARVGPRVVPLLSVLVDLLEAAVGRRTLRQAEVRAVVLEIALGGAVVVGIDDRHRSGARAGDVVSGLQIARIIGAVVPERIRSCTAGSGRLRAARDDRGQARLSAAARCRWI